MNTQDILTRVNAAMALVPKDDAYPYPGTLYGELNCLARSLEEQLRMEIAATNGTANATRTIAKMLNHLKKHDFRESLHYAWLDDQGRQCVCDGYRAYRLNEPLPLEPRPENAGDPIDLEQIIPKDMTHYAAVSLPSAKEVKAFIAIERAKYTGKRGDFVAYWDFGEGLPAVNAAYLLDMIAVFPDAAEIFCGTGTHMISPLVVHCERGDGILLPVRMQKKTDEIARAQVAKDDAERALKAMAEVEGRDVEYIREREQRKAKRKADAKKQLDDQLAYIRTEMALSENYALETDEFEFLVYLLDTINAA